LKGAASAEPTTAYRYRFRFANGAEKEFVVRLSADDLTFVPEPAGEPPAWTRLDFSPCKHCPLPEGTVHCPVAVNLVPVIDFLKDFPSHAEVEVSVEAKGRTYVKKTSLQVAAAALLGLVMSTSGCPILDRLRPMVVTHLPFMTTEEVTYRIISMYLMAQYFRRKAGKTPDWDLDDLASSLEGIVDVNAGICKRLNMLKASDSAVNSVVVLNTLSEWTSLSIRENELERLEGIFLKAYG